MGALMTFYEVINDEVEKMKPERKSK